MLTISRLFGKSPFAPLLTHLELVSHCVEHVPELFKALKTNDFKKIEALANDIAKLEHKADLTKNDIRNQLPNTLFLAIDRAMLLEILSIQDNIADSCEDVGVLLTLKPLTLPSCFEPHFDLFLQKNLDAFHGLQRMMRELHDLMESSFGGVEAEKVRGIIDEIALKEHEADQVQFDLLKALYNADDQFTFSSFYLWQKVFYSLSSISNLSEKQANRVRMTLDLKS